jgi:prevent-host-death family protein
MAQSFDVANAKSRLSELLNRAAFGKERFLIRKHGKPVAAIVSAEDLARLESAPSSQPEGLMAVVGAFGDCEDYTDELDRIVRDRSKQIDREVNLD